MCMHYACAIQTSFDQHEYNVPHMSSVQILCCPCRLVDPWDFPDVLGSITQYHQPTSIDHLYHVQNPPYC